MNAGRIVVMGVSGSGKTTVARELAARLGARYLEADDLHPAANVAKMASGIPLDDDDRWPWLAALRREMRKESDVVVACSALRRPYRDMLRGAGGVRFLYLAVDHDEAVRRVTARTGHYMHAEMVASQFAALEPPTPDETDIAALDTDRLTAAETIAAAPAAIAQARVGTAVEPVLAVGDEVHELGLDELAELVDRIAQEQILASGARRILLVPPDHTRLHSRAGEITARLYETLTAARCDVAVLPALGTHARMTPREVQLLFGGAVPYDAVREHRWRDGLARVGSIGADEVAAVSDGLLDEELPIEVDEQLLAGFDLVVSPGQVVPHEVIGMANFTKNLVIGLGGAGTIGHSHFLSAVCGLESIMGRAQTPVRDLVDAAFDRFLAPRIETLWLLTVMEDTDLGVVQRGLFAGRGGSGATGGAAFAAAAALSSQCNVEVVPEALPRVVCSLDPDEFHSTWLGNKAVYRTRMAIVDGGELVVLAPGVTRFGEDAGVDELIRRHGYRGRTATLEAATRDPDLAASLGAAAHLVHGSSEGRFRITYCTDPTTGGLGREDVEGVGYGWRSLAEELERLALDPTAASGARVDADGVPFTFIANPALGLWSTAARLD